MIKLRRLSAVFICFIMLAMLLCGCGNKSDAVLYSTVDDLEGTRIGVVTGTTFDKLVEQTFDSYELVYLNAYTDLMPALLSDKIDCFIADGPWIGYYSSANTDVTYIDEKINEEDYGLVFPKTAEGAALRDDFNAFLNELPDKEETFSQLEETWFNSDPDAHPDIDYTTLPDINGTISICTDTVNPPFEFYENDKIVGYNINLLYMFCESRGYAMTIADMKFDALIPAVSSGKYDIASSSFTITAERAESVYFSDVIYKSGPVAAIRTENSAQAAELENDSSFLSGIAESFNKTFVRENRWELFAGGIGVTLLVTALSLAAGTAFGFLLYMWYRKGSKLSDKFTSFLSWLISGMPEVLLLLIMFYIVFGNTTITGTWVSVIAFTLIVGVNVFSMTKVGVDAIDRGQMEAALAIGYSEKRGFFRIILPQALQIIMPNYRACVVSLIKSTAIVGYVAVQDLTKVSDIVRSRTYEAFFPLIVTAIIYFVLAWLLIKIVNKLQVMFLPIRNSKKTILRGIDMEEVCTDD